MSVQRAEASVPESAWFKSSYSGGGGGECLEVAAALNAVLIRDSKDLSGPVLTVTPKHGPGSFGWPPTRPSEPYIRNPRGRSVAQAAGHPRGRRRLIRVSNGSAAVSLRYFAELSWPTGPRRRTG